MLTPNTLEFALQKNELNHEKSRQIGSIALDANKYSQIKRSFMLGYEASRKLLAVGLSTVALGGMATEVAVGSNSSQAKSGNLEGCAWDFFTLPKNVTPIECDRPMPDIPEACVSDPNQINFFKYERFKRRQVANISRINEDAKDESIPEHLTLGGQDELQVTQNINGRAEEILLLARLEGETQWRFTVTPQAFRKRLYRKNLSKAIDKVIACGMEPEITIATNKVEWTPKKIRKYVASVARRFGNRVEDFAVFNEINRDGTLAAIEYQGQQLTQAQTARLLFEEAQDAINSLYPNDCVDLGALSSDSHPLKFWDEFLEPLPGEKDKPIKICKFRYHPYEWLKNKPIVFKKKSPGSAAIGISAHETIEDEVQRQFVLGNAQTPDGKEPKVLYDEFGEFQRATKKFRKHNIAPWARARHIIQIFNELCGDTNVSGIYLYMKGSLPKYRKKFDGFDTSEVDNNILDKVAYAEAKWVSQEPTCLAD